MDGYEAATTFTEILQQFEVPSPTGMDTTDLYKYALASTTPENWIPFMPVHVPGNNRSIQLQRAAMPRLFKNAYSHIRPRTELLRQHINTDNQQLKPYYINEEEITRAGIHLQSSFQRTRWYNGAVVNWYGYKKKTGKGEGSSGLQYDIIEPVKK